jgi:adenosylhomocysteine nucleosidase
MSAPVLFVAADPREFAGWVSRWSDVRKLQLPVHWARAGKWCGRDMVAIANGAGWERASAAVRAVEGPCAVYNVGFCGALTATLGIGDIFIAAEVLGAAGLRYPARTPGGAEGRSGTLASVARIVQTATEKKRLSQTGAMVVEMEAAGVARASEELGVPFYCVRAVSDLFSEDFANNFNKFLMHDGRFDVLRLLIGALGSPVARFGELIRLSRRTALASKNLGDFLANCSY